MVLSELVDLTGIMPRQGPPIKPQNPARKSYLVKQIEENQIH